MPPRKKAAADTAVPAAPAADANGTGRATRSRAARNATATPADDSNNAASDAQNDPPPAKAKPARGKKRTTATDGADAQPTQKKAKSSAPAQPAQPAPSPSPSPAAAEPSADKSTPDLQPEEVENAQIAKPGIKVPLDEFVPSELLQFEVYIDDDGVIYDASLNQTNAGQNNNKFYRVQLLRNVAGLYKTWTRWGRVGDRGQSGVLGNGSLDNALDNFNKKFKDKSGLAWADRSAPPKPKKYTFVERSYAEDSDDEEETKTKSEDSAEAPESKLTKPVQELMELIFNQQYFANVMSSMNYDVKKLPLGKLSKTTLTRGYQALKDLDALLNDPTLATSQYDTTFANATEHLSNSYFSLIPHIFGRRSLPVIRDQAMLKQEIELLESLSDMKDADSILKSDKKDIERLNVLDRQFQGLGMEEMTPIKHTSPEFRELKNYLMETRGATHNANYQIDQIFRIERCGEKDRFAASPFAGPPRDRRLLWHGSCATNFGGILSQGLRIAPPEAPVNGYMFGKGIYLADMSSKSANYCRSYVTNGHALLLLCEAELGDPMQQLTNASYSAGEDAAAQGMFSTWGKGTTGPSTWKDAECVSPDLKGVRMPDVSVKPGNTNVPNAYLQYNEYIAYNVAQVRLRYLFRIRM
ncbi:hypothetical protein G7054_g8774 [Neopestalotiopsis clavispora]|nr:hypothetical protein G7054_g8774 [Neopestalotiopsis clavispora]